MSLILFLLLRITLLMFLLYHYPSRRTGATTIIAVLNLPWSQDLCIGCGHFVPLTGLFGIDILLRKPHEVSFLMLNGAAGVSLRLPSSKRG